MRNRMPLLSRHLPPRHFSLALAVGAFTLVASPVSATGTIMVEPKLARVVANGLSPNADALFFGIAREVDDSGPRLIRYQTIRSADANGKARFILTGAEVPRRSIWLVADLDPSGGWPAFEVAGPPPNQGGFEVQEAKFDQASIREDGNGLASLLAVPSQRAIVAVARPGVGSWSCSAVDGAPADGDATEDGGILLSLAGCKAIGTAPPPPAFFDGGDIVVVVDPITLTFRRARIDWR